MVYVFEILMCQIYNHGYGGDTVIIRDMENIENNLKDAGCSPQIAEEFFLLLEEERKKDSLKILRKYRFDLLDYLIRKLPEPANGCWKITKCMTEWR